MQQLLDHLTGLVGRPRFAVLLTVLIPITQRREYALEERRSQLTLQLAILAERKNAKIIEMLENLRQDHPAIAKRVDEEAREMARPAGVEAVQHAI